MCALLYVFLYRNGLKNNVQKQTQKKLAYCSVLDSAKLLV